MTNIEFGPEQLRNLGARLSLLRRNRKLSLRGLSAKSEVSVAAIRELEAGNSSPSLVNVLALAEVLGEPIDRLVAASMEPGRSLQILRGSLRTTGRTGGQIGHLSRPRMRGAILVIAPGSELPEAERPIDLPIFAYVISGAVDLMIAEGRHERLSAGDAIHVAQEPFRSWVNPLAEQAVILYAVALSVAADDAQGR